MNTMEHTGTPAHYYVSPSSISQHGAQGKQVSFSLRDSDHRRVNIPPSISLPVCVIQIAEMHLPNFHIHPCTGLPTFIIGSTGAVSLEIQSTDPNSSQTYYKIIENTMLLCLGLEDLRQDLQVTQKGTYRGSDSNPDSSVGLNLGKLFVERFLSTCSPLSLDSSTVVNWPIPEPNPCSCLNKQKQYHPITIPIYALDFLIPDIPGRKPEKVWRLVPASPSTSNVHDQSTVSRETRVYLGHSHFLILHKGKSNSGIKRCCPESTENTHHLTITPDLQGS